MNPVRVLSAALLAGSLACSSRQAVPVEFISASAPPTVQVSDGYRVLDVTQPRVSGDSLSGMVNGAPTAIPLRRVQSITTVRHSSSRTVLLIGGVAAVSGLIAYAFISDGSGEMVECNYDDPGMLSDLCRINR